MLLRYTLKCTSCTELFNKWTKVQRFNLGKKFTTSDLLLDSSRPLQQKQKQIREESSFRVIKNPLNQKMVECEDQMRFCLQQNRYDEVESIFREMKAKNIRRNGRIYALLFSSLKLGPSNNVIEKIEQTIVEMRNDRVRPSLVLCNTLLDYFLRFETQANLRLKKMERILVDMEQHLIAPDVQTINLMILASSLFGDNVRVMKYWKRISEENLRPNIISYNWMLQHFARTAEYKQAIDLFETMAHEGVKHDTLTYDHLFNCFSRAGQYSLIPKYLRMMQNEGVPFDTVTVNTLLTAYRDQEDTENTLSFFYSVKDRSLVDEISYKIVLRILIKLQKHEDVSLLFDELIQKTVNRIKINVQLAKVFLENFTTTRDVDRLWKLLTMREAYDAMKEYQLVRVVRCFLDKKDYEKSVEIMETFSNAWNRTNCFEIVSLISEQVEDFILFEEVIVLAEQLKEKLRENSDEELKETIRGDMVNFLSVLKSYVIEGFEGL